MEQQRPGFGERISVGFTRAMRSWYFLLFFLVVWGAWWTVGAPTGGWWYFVTHWSDPFPFPFWGNCLAALTMVDLIVVGIAQVKQGDRQEAVLVRLEAAERLQTQMATNQLDTLKSLQTLMEANLALARLAEARLKGPPTV